MNGFASKRALSWGALGLGLLLAGVSLLSGAEAGAVRKVTGVSNTYPSWSPDGTRIAFHSTRFGTEDIWVAQPDGNGLVRLTDHPAADQTPSWSPDGKKIVFQSLRDGNEEIYVMNADGTGLVNVSRHPSADSHPYWSPDGTRIIFNTNRDDGETDEVYTMKADGSDLRRLTRNNIWDTYASSSPDGRKILFRARIQGPGLTFDGKPMDFNSEIFVMDADGTNPVNLTRHPAFDGWPSWSPDGKRIAFASARAGIVRVFVMNADGSDVRPLLAAPGDGELAHPDWSPDGKSIVFTRNREDTVDLYIAPAP